MKELLLTTISAEKVFYMNFPGRVSPGFSRRIVKKRNPAGKGKLKFLTGAIVTGPESDEKY